MQIVTLGREHLASARALLAAAFPYDKIETVAEEKLFAGGVAIGAVTESDGALVGVAAFERRWVKLLAVAEAHRRRGIGTALLGELRENKRRIFDHPGNYLSPGIDARYDHGWLERRGFRVVGEVENIRATRFPDPFPVEGYQIRRADEPALLEWIAKKFAPVWAREVERAMRGPRRAVHAALQNNSYVGFAAADGNNQGLGWFGPAGTDESHRGKRLGEALLIRCLQDVRGLPEAGVIAWIGPKEFYRKTVGAVEDRRFVQMEEA